MFVTKKRIDLFSKTWDLASQDTYEHDDSVFFQQRLVRDWGIELVRGLNQQTTDVRPGKRGELT